MKKLLEVCVDSVESAMIAQEGGADRLEVCSNLVIGGTTPGVSQFKQIRKACNIKLNVLIRPRFGDFLYTEPEFLMIAEDIRMFRELGADGVVVGCLTPDGRLDVKRMQTLRDCAGDLHMTLHRAFDVCQNPDEALRTAISLKIDTILTSGQEADCVKGKAVLKRLIRQAGEDIEILVGSGVDDTDSDAPGTPHHRQWTNPRIAAPNRRSCHNRHITFWPRTISRNGAVC